MKAASLTLLLALTATSCAVVAEPPLSSKELSLGGVAIGDSEADAASVLGQSVRTEHPDNHLSIKLESGGIMVLTDPQEGVGEIFSNAPQYCTPSGACPGMAFDKIPKAMGRARITKQGGSRFLAQYSTTTDCWIELSVSAERVESVRIACPV